jgi:hypothetical protein
VPPGENFSLGRERGASTKKTKDGGKGEKRKRGVGVGIGKENDRWAARGRNSQDDEIIKTYMQCLLSAK